MSGTMETSRINPDFDYEAVGGNGHMKKLRVWLELPDDEMPTLWLEARSGMKVLKMASRWDTHKCPLMVESTGNGAVVHSVFRFFKYALRLPPEDWGNFTGPWDRIRATHRDALLGYRGGVSEAQMRELIAEVMAKFK